MGKTVLAILVVLGFGGLARAERPVARLRHESYVETRTRRVLAALLRFATVRTSEEEQDRLTSLRARDALRLPGGAESLQAAGYGAALFGAAMVLAAHAPAALRPLVDGPVHVGPALFDSGGLGAGVGGRF
jgi:hypothetical protein